MIKMQIKRLIHELSGLYYTLPVTNFLLYVTYIILNIQKILRSGRLVSADLMMKGECQFWVWDTAVMLNCHEIDKNIPFDNSSSFTLARELYCRNVYLRAFKKFNAKKKTIVDIGGNRGFASLLMAKALLPERLIYIEPDVRYANTLKNIFLENQVCLELIVIHMMIGRKTTDSDLPVQKLENVLSMYNIDKIALLKMDIEGAEVEALNSNSLWLNRVERIAMESHPNYGDMNEVCSVLETKGFKVTATDPLMRSIEPNNSSYIYAVKDRDYLNRILRY
jgi:hypothetical protein